MTVLLKNGDVVSVDKFELPTCTVSITKRMVKKVIYNPIPVGAEVPKNAVYIDGVPYIVAPE